MNHLVAVCLAARVTPLTRSSRSPLRRLGGVPSPKGTATEEELNMVHVLGKLEPLDPRKVWPYEARDFTPWLLENADALADVLGIDMELSAAEHPVGG